MRLYLGVEIQGPQTARHVTADGGRISISADLADLNAQRQWSETVQSTEAGAHYDLNTCDNWLLVRSNVHFARHRNCS